MRRSLLALVASLAVASASILPASVHQVELLDVVGSFRFRSLELLQCPSRIEHTEIPAPGSRVIPHSTMTHNRGAACQPGQMTVFGSADLALIAVDNQSSEDFIRTYRDSGEPAIYAVEEEGRKCGATSFSAGTVVIFVVPTELLELGQNLAFPPGRRYMIIDDPETAGNCLYAADLRVIPTPEPIDPTPAPGNDAGPGMGEAPSDTPEPSEGGGGAGVGGKPGKGKGKGKGKEEDDDMEMSPEPDVTPDEELDETSDDDDDICFPADAQVETEDGTLKKISDVQIGDRLKVADGVYSDVFMFTHKDATTVHDFITLSTNSGDKISATRGHYLYINGQFAAAVTAKVGDILELGNGARTSIKRVSIEHKTGLFNPQTIHGDLVVNSIRASTFTRTVEPPTAQALLAPLRMVYDVLGLSTSFLDNGADSVAALLPKGRFSL